MISAFGSDICRKLNPNPTPNNREPIPFGLYRRNPKVVLISAFSRLAGITGFPTSEGRGFAEFGLHELFPSSGDYVVLGIIWRKSLLATWRKAWVQELAELSPETRDIALSRFRLLQPQT
jgi:hypothetical protein